MFARAREIASIIRKYKGYFVGGFSSPLGIKSSQHSKDVLIPVSKRSKNNELAKSFAKTAENFHVKPL
jgi:hypothetical protein